MREGRGKPGIRLRIPAPGPHWTRGRPSAADSALFEALEHTVRQTGTRQLVRLPSHINDPAFSDALAAAFESLAGARTPRARGGRRQGAT